MDALGRDSPGELDEVWQSSQTMARLQESLNKHLHVHAFLLSIMLLLLDCFYFLHNVSFENL